MTSEILSIRSFFQSIQVHLSGVWLESCVNWCKNETLGLNYTLKELHAKVYEQWLLLDLRDVEVPCLPPKISSHKHFLLNGNFCLQMIQVIDISKPKLWQLQRIRNNLSKGEQQDLDTGGTGKRMLQLTLTDGVQEVEAMEYKLISCLSINLVPGIKIRIMGPVVVRRGRLLLEPQNVKILGGEVEELLVSNAAENVLARILKLPENPNPSTIEEKLLASGTEEENNLSRIIQPWGCQKLSEIPRPQQNDHCKTEVAPMMTDEETKEIENMMLEAERNLPTFPSNTSKTPDLFEDDDFIPENFDCFNEFAFTSTQAPTKKLNQPQTSTFDDDIFDEIDIDAHLDEVDNSNKQDNQETTIANLLEKRNNDRKGLFKVRAKFKTVVEKLTVGEEEYKLIITIEDDTADLVVKVHTDLISEFAGYTPAGIQTLKSSILCKEDNAVEKVMKAIQRVKDKLVKLDGLMAVNISSDEIPTITKIY